MKLKLSREASQAREELINLREKVEKCEETIQDKRDEIATKESALNQLDSTYKREKQVGNLVLYSNVLVDEGKSESETTRSGVPQERN